MVSRLIITKPRINFEISDNDRKWISIPMCEECSAKTKNIASGSKTVNDPTVSKL